MAPWAELGVIQSSGGLLAHGSKTRNGDAKAMDDVEFFSLAGSGIQAAPGLPSITYKYTLHGRNHTLALPFHPLTEMRSTLTTMQDRFFEIWLGQWPDAIDWTAAVVGSYLSSCVITLARETSTEASRVIVETDEETRRNNQQSEKMQMELDNEMNRYFSHTVSYYFAENALDIRNEAHDDMLWVVLGWLESIKFMNLRASQHFPTSASPTEEATSNASSAPSWYGTQFQPAFAHRAHIFYSLVRGAWDRTTCGGGISWNRNLAPYKNTITNTLFITASVSMYLHHPGDKNASPFLASPGTSTTIPPAHAHDRQYLEAAIAAYDWLTEVNLTTAQGLYVDGYHIRDWKHGGDACNERNEALYTYNQGVLLSGLRDLWEATGETDYLWDAHQLVRNIVTATGWDLATQAAVVIDESDEQQHRYPLGTRGILTEACDASGSCNQNEQSFKGIFFHHLGALCLPLPRTDAEATVMGLTFLASRDAADRHAEYCKSYIAWVARNAVAAMKTKDEEGVVGGWWVVGSGGVRANVVQDDEELGRKGQEEEREHDQQRLSKATSSSPVRHIDPNDRGRGRTLETHSAGLMVVRTLWELLRVYSEAG